MLIRLQVDVGFGDPVVPVPIFSEFPALLAGHGPIIRAYSAETVIAEKFNAMVVLGMANSRMKDYFDIWMLSRSYTFQGIVLRNSILQTFTRRRTKIPVEVPIGLSPEFSLNATKRLQWQGFVRRTKRKEISLDLESVVLAVREFVMPLVFSAFEPNEMKEVWVPLQGWQNEKIE